MINIIYALSVFFVSPILTMPFVYWFFKDFEPVKEIMIRVYILLVVSNILNSVFSGSFPTPL